MKKKTNPFDRLVARMEKRFGKGSLMYLNDTSSSGIGSFSTGSIGLDRALGINGLPRGRVIEVYGPESSGKTTLALHAIAQIQQAGGCAAFIDAEHALDATYARALGVDFDRCLVSQPDHGEQALEIAEELARTESVDLIVIDSVAALTPRAEIEGDMGAPHMGLQARLMSQALRKLTAAAHRCDTSVLFINQLRQKIGVVFGSNETTPGGNALKFYASVRLDIRRIGSIKGPNQELIANKVRVKVVKNKVAPPFRQTEFEIFFGRGICQAGEVIDLAIDAGVLEQSGSWFSFEGAQLGQGRERVRACLTENSDLMSRVVTALASPKNNEDALAEAA